MQNVIKKTKYLHNNLNLNKYQERKVFMQKEKIKDILCKAIDNIPDYAEVKDFYTEHSYGDNKAYIKVVVELKDTENDNIEVFNDIAHNSFNTEMDFIS